MVAKKGLVRHGLDTVLPVLLGAHDSRRRLVTLTISWILVAIKGVLNG